VNPALAPRLAGAGERLGPSHEPWTKAEETTTRTLEQGNKEMERPMRYRILSIVALALVGWALGAASASAQKASAQEARVTRWHDVFKQDANWFKSGEARRIANNVLLCQHDDGGWPKNLDMTQVFSEEKAAQIADARADVNDSTIDNNATYEQLRFLAQVQTATGDRRYRAAFDRGLDFLLDAQYANGGWPQFPRRASGYWLHVTYNDDAMIGVMRLLRDVAAGQSPFAFVDAPRRAKASRSVARGTDCILRTQLRVGGRLTAWCAQYDENTLKPAKARSYEPACLVSKESVGIVRFLMEIDQPSPQVVESVQSAIAWLVAVKVVGQRVERGPATAEGSRGDVVVVADPDASPIWARFYEIGTNRPIFSGRDGVIKYSLAEIERERRSNYSWLGDYATSLLVEDYPQWMGRWAPQRDLLAGTAWAPLVSEARRHPRPPYEGRGLGRPGPPPIPRPGRPRAYRPEGPAPVEPTPGPGEPAGNGNEPTKPSANRPGNPPSSQSQGKSGGQPGGSSAKQPSGGNASPDQDNRQRPRPSGNVGSPTPDPGGPGMR
jgi:PelA/Pel-15E family pectate lyase